jgi:hypothetical protein
MPAGQIYVLYGLALVLSLLFSVQANAVTFSTDCRYIGNNRSIVVVRASGVKGNYYARVYSYNLDQWLISSPKAASANGLIRFDFDSVKRPGATLLPAHFNKSGKAGGTLRKHKLNTLMAKISSPCFLR